MYVIDRDEDYELTEPSTKEEEMYRELQKVLDAGIDPFNYFD